MHKNLGFPTTQCVVGRGRKDKAVGDRMLARRAAAALPAAPPLTAAASPACPGAALNSGKTGLLKILTYRRNKALFQLTNSAAQNYLETVRLWKQSNSLFQLNSSGSGEMETVW